MIKPGDTIGEMLVTEAEVWDWSTNLHSQCEEHGERVEDRSEEGKVVVEVTCNLVPGTEILLTCGGVYADPALGEDLDSEWPKLKTRMKIDGQELDMSSFGQIDFEYEHQVRTWNVKLENLTPGMHTFYCLNEQAGEDTYENTFYFNVQTVTYPALPADAVAGQHAYTSATADLDFLLYVPEAYGQDPTREWPMILFLHGFVDGIQSIEQLRRQDFQDKLEQDADFPFIVVSPIRTGGRGDFEYWFRKKHTAPLFRLLEEVSSLYSVDTSRIYLNGESAGGNGVWEIGIQYPDRFAALVPVMGYYGYPFEVPDNICDLKDMPIWAFHGALDEMVPLDAEQSLVDALNDCGGQAQITVIPDIGHDLTTEHVYSPELTDWLLSHSLE